MAHELHRWADKYGQAWACGAYDHGPMCRLCTKVDATLALVLENVDHGRMEFVGTDPGGEMRFRVTPGGERRIEELLADHSDGYPRCDEPGFGVGRLLHNDGVQA